MDFMQQMQLEQHMQVHHDEVHRQQMRMQRGNFGASTEVQQADFSEYDRYHAAIMADHAAFDAMHTKLHKEGSNEMNSTSDNFEAEYAKINREIDETFAKFDF